MTEEGDGKRLLCQNCGHVWSYGGNAEKYASCGVCGYRVNIEKRHLKLDDQPDDLVQHLEDQEWTEDLIRVWNFHLALRERTDLSHVTRVDYVKAAHRIFVEGEDPEDVSNGSACLKKMTELLEDNEEEFQEEDN